MTSWSFSGPKIEYECDEIKKSIDILIKAMHRLTHMDREELVKAAIWNLERYLEEQVAKEKYGEDGEGDIE